MVAPDAGLTKVGAGKDCVGVSGALGMLVGVGVSVGTDAMVVPGTGVSVGANGLVGAGTQDDIENRTMMAKVMPAKHVRELFLLFIQFMIAPLVGGPAKYCPGILHNKQP